MWRERTGVPQAGMTLVEVVVSIAVLAVVTALAVSAILSGQRVAGESTTRFNAEQAIEQALAIMLPELRQSGAAASGSGIVVEASPEGGANQQIRFRKNVGFNTASMQIVWSADEVVYWYETAGGRLKRREGPAGPTVIAAGIDPTFSFTLVSDQVTINMAVTKQTIDRKNLTVTAAETVALRN